MSEVIYYEKFSENEVFEDPMLNVTFNQLYTYLINSVGEKLVVEGLLLDNEVAYILQGGIIASPLRKVELITASKDLFNYIKNSYSALNVSQIISDEKTITMVINDKRISFTLSLQDLNSTNVEGIRVKTITV